MQKTVKRYLVPGDHNEHNPHILKPKALASMTLTLFILKFIIGALLVLVPSLAFANVGITTEELLACTNKHRAERSLNKLVLNSKLSRAAQEKLDDMDEYDYWAHANPFTGTSPWVFFDQIQYPYITAGENLAFSFKTSDGVCKGWMDSPTHRANILDPTFQEVGFAVRDVDLGKNGSGILISQFFGSRLDYYEQDGDLLDDKCVLSVPGGPEIISPECGYSNDTSPDITAKTSNINQEIHFRINESDYEGKVLSEGQNRMVRLPKGFELPEGKNTIEAMIIDQNQKSAITTVNVDTKSPVIFESTLQVETYKKDGNYIFELSLVISDENLEESYISYKNDKGSYDKEPVQLLGDDAYYSYLTFAESQGSVIPITIHAIDKAGNSSTTSVELLADTGDIKGIATGEDGMKIDLEAMWRYLVSGFLVLIFIISVMASISYKWKADDDRYLHSTAQTVILGIVMILSVYLLF